MSSITIFCREGACNVHGHTTQNCNNRRLATARVCINCNGTGTRSWPQSRQVDPRRPLERETLPPQITKCGACGGTGGIGSPEEVVAFLRDAREETPTVTDPRPPKPPTPRPR